MGYLCDHCDRSLQLGPMRELMDGNGMIYCDKNPGGYHEWEGRKQL
jgi:hypothetical protein